MSSGDYMKPIRPPRSVKTTKDTKTGYLMKIIQTLSISHDNAERDRQKEMLEKEFSDSDRSLVRLVKAHQDELTKAMQNFSKNSANLRSSMSKCHDIREKLTRCTTLLHCRRDELKRLWLEVMEHKRVMCMLQEIEDVMTVHEKVEGFSKAKMYLDATKLLVSSIALFEESLNDIDALKELKNELYAKREELHHVLIKELHSTLYVSSANHILKQFKRHGSGRTRHEKDVIAHFAEKNAEESQNPDGDKNASLDTLKNGSSPSAWMEDSLCDVDSETIQSSISTLAECVSLLQRIPETMEILKEKCQRELLAILRRTAQHVVDVSQKNVPLTYQQSYLGSDQNKDEECLLSYLLELVFEQFKSVIKNHRLLLMNLQIHCDKNEDEREHIYEMADIWSQIQSVLEIFFVDYLDSLTNTQAPKPPSHTFSKVASAVDISSFFLRKRNSKSKSYSLFKFDSSSHALSMKTYLQEQKEALKEKGEMDAFDSETQVYVCQPATKNIIIIFQPLSKFIADVTEEMKVESRASCPLHTFISGCVKVFIGQITMEANHVIESALKSLENWRVISDADKLKKAGVTTFLLHSTLCIDYSVKELNDLIYALPTLHSSHILSIICNMLQSYREACQAAYTSLIQPNSEDKRIISSSWVRDKDISRLLRSLPNWTNLNEKDCLAFESSEDIRFRNKKESEILIANLSGDTLILQHEILSDTNHLRNLALLHESLVWLSASILLFANSLPNQTHNNLMTNPQEIAEDDIDIDPIPDVTVDSFIKLSNDYSALADTCLLLLHLEVRVHCFFYLQPLTLNGCYAARVDNQEPDPEVVKLNTDLSKIEESLQSVLKPCNTKYIFEGLGELISTILINSTSKIKRINENGVKKINRNIFALQQNLTGITMFREVALDRARQYFDLLSHTPEEILNLIVENGPQFHELEYSAAFHLLMRIQPGTESCTLDSYLDRLHQILNEVAVSV